MSIKNYTYPRVETKVNALLHSSSVPEPDDTTVLFMPLITTFGPTKTVKRIHSLSEFISIYGSLDFDKNGISALTTYNWLTNGGTIYAYRLDNTGETQNVGLENNDEFIITNQYAALKKGDITIFSAKYPGVAYNTLEVVIRFITPTTFSININIKDPATGKIKTVESFPMLNEENYKKAIIASEYISCLNILDTDLTEDKKVKGYTITYSAKSVNTSDLTLQFEEAAGEKDQITALKEFWGVNYKTVNGVETVEFKQDEDSECYAALSNELETPIDLIMDCAYPLDIKKAMMNFITSTEESGSVRNDIYGYFDGINLWTEEGKPSKLEIIDEYQESDFKDFNDYHYFINYGYYTISDNIFADQDIYVGLNYFYSSMIPYSDALYGIQYPLAGHRRGVLVGCKNMSKNPTPAEKQKLFDARLNYVEKTAREYVIMTQRTHDGSTFEAYTALSFINNVRVLERMKKDLNILGRNYLHEFNDSMTLSQMSNVLNKYVGEWISNKTLEYGVVTVEKNLYSDEAVNVDLAIKFKGTIEVIYTTITIA